MIKVDVTGFAALKARLAGMGRQIPYAASQALNATGRAVADAMPAEIEKAIDRPMPFTKSGVRLLKKADKSNLEATVGFMTAQAKYMKWATDGGTRQPGAGGLKLPTAIKVNEFGNIPKGVIAQLISVARKDQTKGGKDKKLSKATTTRIKVSARLELFYGDPADQAGKVWPRGIYKIANGALIPLIVFPNKAAHYKVRLDFPRIAERIVKREWSRQFDAALADAIRKAR